MKIKELKKELRISNNEIAEFFGLNPISYANSSAKKRYENALCKFYAFVKSKAGGEKENKTHTDIDLKNEQPLNLQNVMPRFSHFIWEDNDNERFELDGTAEGREEEAYNIYPIFNDGNLSFVATLEYCQIPLTPVFLNEA